MASIPSMSIGSSTMRTFSPEYGRHRTANIFYFSVSTVSSSPVPADPSTTVAISTKAGNKTGGPTGLSAQELIFFNWLESQVSRRVKRQASQQEPAGNLTADALQLARVPQLLDAERRQGTTQLALKKKILNMMLQSMYSAQERLWPLEPIVRKYENLTPYRMAFIFMKLDQLIYEAHSLCLYLERTVNDKSMTLTSRLQLYSQVLRRNIDITYMAEYISQRVPRDQVVRIRSYMIRHEQENLVRHKIFMDRTKPPNHKERPWRLYTKGLHFTY